MNVKPPVNSPEGLMIVALPESTVGIVAQISAKTGQAPADVMSTALLEYAQRVLKSAEKPNTIKAEQAQKALGSTPGL